MAKSKTSDRHKAYSKKKAKQKQLLKHKQKQMEQNLNQGPVTFVYQKDKQTVEIPLKEWQTLNQAATRLQDIAMFVATMEQVGRQHIDDGTLLPVFQNDLEPTTTLNPDGTPQMKIKDSFWTGKSDLGKPTIVKADGETIYDSSEEENKKSTIIMP